MGITILSIWFSEDGPDLLDWISENGGTVITTLAIWLIFAVLTAKIAAVRGRKKAPWFILGLFFGPLALLAVFILSALPTPETHLQCPDCAELARKEARVCKHCGCRLAPAE
jgi:hypothetical protein